MLRKEVWMKIRQLYEQGLSISEIASVMGIDRKTARKYAKERCMPSYSKRLSSKSKLKPYNNYIKERLMQYNLTAEKLYKEIQKQGYTGSYSLLANYVAECRNYNKKQAVLRFETMPGQQGQVDWGYLGTIYDIERRSWIKLNCFLLLLGYSRKLYAEVFELANLSNFLIAHNNAFKYFGGYPRELLYDNLKSVVIKRALCAKDSEFNKKFMDFAGYYGFSPILCRPYKPNTKGKVENSVHYIKQNFYCGENFNSLREVNERLQAWLKVIDGRIHGTTKEKPQARFNRETLISLTNKDLYDTSTIYWRKVSRDCFFNFQGNRYSVPYEYANKEISIKLVDNVNLQISYRTEVIAQHILEASAKGLFIQNPKHFAGLLELRKSHALSKPKCKKNKEIKGARSLGVVSRFSSNVINTVVEQRELSIYEEVIS